MIGDLGEEANYCDESQPLLPVMRRESFTAGHIEETVARDLRTRHLKNPGRELARAFRARVGVILNVGVACSLSLSGREFEGGSEPSIYFSALTCCA